MAGLRFRVSTLPDALREEFAGAFRSRAKPSLDAAAVSTGPIDRIAPPISPPCSRAPFAAARRVTSQ